MEPECFGKCNGCKYHSKDPEPGMFVYEDGSPRDDICSHPNNLKTEGFNPVPVFNYGCKCFEAN